VSREAGRLFIFSAPSGGGKTSLANALVESEPNTVVSISHTTRPPRPGEQNGVDYYFVDRKEFESMIEAGLFLEYARVFDNLYGTSREALEAQLRAGHNVILDIDWQGARRVREQMPATRSIFIIPPSKEVLEQRLRGRGQDSKAVITRRMRDAVSEMRHANEFDYLVVNDDFDAALADLKAIVEGRMTDVRPCHIDIEALLRE